MRMERKSRSYRRSVEDVDVMEEAWVTNMAIAWVSVEDTENIVVVAKKDMSTVTNVATKLTKNVVTITDIITVLFMSGDRKKAAVNMVMVDIMITNIAASTSMVVSIMAQRNVAVIMVMVDITRVVVKREDIMGMKLVVIRAAAVAAEVAVLVVVVVVVIMVVVAVMLVVITLVVGEGIAFHPHKWYTIAETLSAQMVTPSH